jgi:hypothetical protein
MSKNKKRSKQDNQDPFTVNQIRVCLNILRMPDAIANVMGGPTKAQAREFLKSQGIEVEEC